MAKRTGLRQVTEHKCRYLFRPMFFFLNDDPSIMLCPDCQTELSSSPDADVQICQKCRASPKKRNRKVPKLSPKSAAVKIRVDAAHQGSEVNNGIEQQDSELIEYVGSWIKTKSLIHVAVLGLLVFLIGQSIHVWAFWVGNYFAWTVANLLTVAGICISVFSIAVTLQNFERKVDLLATLVSRKSTPNKSKRKFNSKRTQKS